MEEDRERPSQIVLYHDRSPLHTNFLVKEERIEVNVKKVKPFFPFPSRLRLSAERCGAFLPRTATLTQRMATLVQISI